MWDEVQWEEHVLEATGFDPQLWEDEGLKNRAAHHDVAFQAYPSGVFKMEGLPGDMLGFLVDEQLAMHAKKWRDGGELSRTQENLLDELQELTVALVEEHPMLLLTVPFQQVMAAFDDEYGDAIRWNESLEKILHEYLRASEGLDGQAYEILRQLMVQVDDWQLYYALANDVLHLPREEIREELRTMRQQGMLDPPPTDAQIEEEMV